MTIWTLIIIFAIAGGILTLLSSRFFKAQKSWVMSFLQNFTGVWFIFSGFVKAVDPMGTAFKMQQYFGKFETTFEETAAKFIAPLFPWLGEYAVGFSIFMIILEIIIGLMLILGHRPKLTAWLFLVIMVFFTVLTGYTHMTGYVPSGVNFFDFDKWGDYVATNMQVTDCGCFGDFLKLSPTTSFYKDLALMPIALFFVWRHRQFHQLFTSNTRFIIIIATLVASLVFCLYNTYLDEPIFDFRPFKNGVNIRERKEAEQKAVADVKITHYVLENKNNGQKVKLTYKEYIDDKGYNNYKETDGWKVADQLKTTPSVETTKISDFSINNTNGEDVSEALLTEPAYQFLIVSWKMKSVTDVKTILVPDSVFRYDTVRMKVNGVDTFTIKKVFERVGQREEKFKAFRFDEEYRKSFENLNPFIAEAEKAGCKIVGLVPFSDPKKIEDFRHAAQTAYPFYTADDLLLKTMIRSNPGIILLKNGKIVQKWHLSKIPTFLEVKNKFLQ